MKAEEAIKKLEYIRYVGNGEQKYQGCSEEIAINLAIESLEKQIPKKVQIKRWSPARCPSCDTELSEDCGDGYYRHPTFLEVCPNVECCQRLDWSEDDG